VSREGASPRACLLGNQSAPGEFLYLPWILGCRGWPRIESQRMTPTKTLLLVEDEGLVRHDLKEGLVEAGFDVSDVAQGGKALSELEADPSRFSGLITDIRLGRGPDGWEIARRARELIPNLPVIYISGHGSAEWPSKGVPNSLTLSKPFATAQLITAISTLLVEADAHKAREG
jgi:DNA-binding response OmpR family regulator